MTDLSLWPGTLWTTSEPTGNICIHCHRDYNYHGATEIIAQKKGVRLNQRHLLCRPPGDINPEAVCLNGDIMNAFAKDHALMTGGNTNTK